MPAEVRCCSIRHDRARVAPCLEHRAHEGVESEALGPGELDDAPTRGRERDAGQSVRYLARRHRLHGRRGQPHRSIDGGCVGDAGRELEELARPHERERDPGCLHEPLLHALGAVEARVGEPVGTDRGEGHVVPHARLRARPQQLRRALPVVAQHGLVAVAVRLGDIHDDLHARERLGEARARRGVDTRAG
jgi:hypothetical protein